MEREYDLINELGPRNWLDAAAGEAVLLGSFTHDIELEMRGTALAGELVRVRYDHDSFGKVEAQAKDLVDLIAKKKIEQKMVVFIDDICVWENGKRSLCDWEYELTLADGKYRICLSMPQYYGQSPCNEISEKVEEVVRNSYKNPSFNELEIVRFPRVIGVQRMDTTSYYTTGDILISSQTDFNHEHGTKRGREVTYYIDDYAQAMTAWEMIRAISSQRK
jgi:hypothetical protein